MVSNNRKISPLIFTEIFPYVLFLTFVNKPTEALLWSTKSQYCSVYLLDAIDCSKKCFLETFKIPAYWKLAGNVEILL